MKNKINKKEVLEKLKILNGIPPHDGSSNVCVGDGYYAKFIEAKYGMKIPELSKLVSFDEVIARWNKIRKDFKLSTHTSRLMERFSRLKKKNR